MSDYREPKWKHRPCPCGCGEMADECMRPMTARYALNAFDVTPTSSVPLSDLYDGDKARRDPRVARLRWLMTIPHPLHEVQYADGFLPDTTAGQVLAHGRRVTR
jgi:hypothetical protein